MITAVISIGVIAGLFGVILALASEKFKVEEDPKVTEVNEALPGTNCGACGFPGCAGLAEAIVNGEAPIDSCPPGRGSSDIKIAEIMGVDYSSDGGKNVPQLMCAGGDANCKNKYEYDGVEDCKAAIAFYGGHKACDYGCLGLGTCKNVCAFDAITMDENNLPEIHYNLCTSCGLCAQECPTDVLRMVDIEKRVHVRCINLDKGKDAKKACSAACIKCKKCEKACPTEAIKVRSYDGGSIADIEYEKCNNCGACVEACPVNIITISDPLPGSQEAENKAAVTEEVG